MCNDIKQMQNVSVITNPIIVNLPDGSVKRVTKMGSVRLTPKLVLNEVLYTPYFQFNLIYVNTVTKHAPVKFISLSN